ncbi:hypothetical protein Bra471DRAFT_01609 [Bradyrhizobium sp. WSM471]|nr:hypothetical protein Bra471DRAFT_01609 [Bradyrhizobium sp. WSM471]
MNPPGRWMQFCSGLASRDAGCAARSFTIPSGPSSAGAETPLRTGRNQSARFAAATRSLEMRRTAVALILTILSSGALADDFVGQASVIDGDTLDMHGVRIRLWALMHRKAASCAAAKTACNTVAVRRPQTTLTPSLPAVPSIVSRSASTRMAARWRPARLVVRTSANGLCTTVLRWIGLNIRRADIAKLSARLSAPARVSGRAVTWSHGSIVHASAQVESRPPVRMMQMPILDAIPARRQSTTCVGQSPHLRRWLWRGLGDSRYPSFLNHLTA